MTSLHGAVHRDQGVMLYHDQPPDGHCQSQPDRYVVDHQREVGVEQVEGSPEKEKIRGKRISPQYQGSKVELFPAKIESNFKFNNFKNREVFL